MTEHVYCIFSAFLKGIVMGHTTFDVRAEIESVTLQ